jgi:peptidoglycan/LPS O-acetylase OafA/YrhL
MTTTVTDAPASQRSRASTWVHMPGLDGVRAIAVTGVLVFHAKPEWLPGGFLGVDVFFALSGFLITSLLLAELGETGSVRFGRFYVRRARRLLPALFLVLIATSVLATTVAQDAAARVREDVVAAFFYMTNWWYVLHGQSYFEATGRPPMLQHLWSLAVEEQFYLVWPLLLFGLWRLGRVRGVRIGAAAGALLSTALMTWIAVRDGMPDVVDASRVYFGTDTHAMTLLVGAVLATLWTPRRIGSELTARGRQVTAAVGFTALVALVAIFWLVGPLSPALYRGGFLVVALVSTAVVAASAVTGTAFSSLLARQPLRWLGERSYGIYLWHWPIFMVLRPGIDLDAAEWQVQVLRFALTFGAAELSYRFVEMPIRRGALGRAWASWKARGGTGFGLRAAAAGVATVALVAALGMGLSSAHEPTVEDALGGLQSVGDDPLTPSPTPSGTGGTAVVSPSPSTSSPATPSVSASAPTTAPLVPAVVPAGETVFGLPATAVGDSVMLAARKSMQATFPTFMTVDAHISRQPAEIFDRIRARKATGQLGDVVVIHAGTNGPIKTTELIKLVGELSDRSRVILVTCHGDRSWIAQSNAAIASAAKYFAGTNVRVADWAAASNHHIDWFYADGIHTKSAGSDAYAALIKTAMAQ